MRHKKWFAPLLLLLTISVSALAATNDWMSDIPGDRTLNQLMIPGTHDSGSFGIKPQSKFSLSPDDPLPLWIEEISNILPVSVVRPIVAAWSKTQPHSVFWQLNAGVRYLDLRVCYFQSHFYLCHALISVRLKKVLQQIQLFTQQNPSEIIFLDMNHVYNITNSAEETQLVTLLKHYLGSCLIPNTYHATDTMQTMRQSGRTLIVFMNAAQSVGNPFWPESRINSPWPNASTVTALKNTLDSEMALRSKTYKTSARLFALQVIQTENVTEIIDGILNPAIYPHALKPFESPVNRVLGAWINEYVAQYQTQSVNIVLQDWLTEKSPLVSLAIQYDTQNVPAQHTVRGLHKKLMALARFYHGAEKTCVTLHCRAPQHVSL